MIRTQAARSISALKSSKAAGRVPVAWGMLALLAACGSSSTPGVTPPSPAAKPDVIVTLDASRRACSVALPSEPHGSEVACKDVVSFVKDEMRIASGSGYEIRTVANADAAQTADVKEALNSAGYRFIGETATH